MRGKKVESIASAAILQYSSKIVCIILQLLLQAVLARILIPDDFGLVAVVTVFIAFFNILADLGIGPAIIQFRDLSKRDYGALFVFSIASGIVLSLLFCGLSFIVSAVYSDTRYIRLLCIASVAVMFTALNLVPNGVLLKEKRFVAIALRQVAANAIGAAVSIWLAFQGAGCLALIAYTIVVSLIVLLWNLVSVHREIVLNVSGLYDLLKRIFSYSAYQSIWGIVNYFSRNLDNLLVARVMGPSLLGYYDRAYKLTTYPITNISSVLSSVLQPYLAELQNNLDVLYQKYADISKLMSLVGCYITVICVFCSKEIVLLFYGGQWVDSVILFQILSVSIVFQMVDNVVAPVLQSAGRTDMLFVSGGVSTCVTVLAIAVGVVASNLTILAALVALAYCTHFGIYVYFLVYKLFSKSVVGFLKLFLPECIFVCICFVVALLFSFFPQNSLGISLLIKASVFAVVYAIIFIVMRQKQYVKRALGK